ncbi:hypothetical protein C8Q80DRAFT_662413 [Daedaleopsis nitida]|nr:hypothetical protein C8Q80DRAFT_662413 [Daedaleopsis nitida]
MLSNCSFVQVEFVRFIPFMWLIWGVLLAAVLVDLVSTSILIYYLRNNRTGFKKTDSMIDVLIVDTLIWAAITVVATKMYVNSLLAVLNSRQAILEQGLNGFDSGSFGMKVVTPCNGTTHAVELAQEHSRSLQVLLYVLKDSTWK